MTRPGEWTDTPDELRAWDRQTDTDDRPTVFDLDDLPDTPPLSAGERAESVAALVAEQERVAALDAVRFWDCGGA